MNSPLSRRHRGLKEDESVVNEQREPLFKQSLGMREPRDSLRRKTDLSDGGKMSSAAIRQAVCCDSLSCCNGQACGWLLKLSPSSESVFMPHEPFDKRVTDLGYRAIPALPLRYGQAASGG